MEQKNYELVDGVEKLESAIAQVREAQRIYSTYTQEQVDKIFLAAATAANHERIPLAKMAVEETGMGVVEDKVIKNHYAAEYIYNAYKNTKTCGVVEEDKAFGYKRVAEPIGLVAAVIPTTNPTSTAIFKTLLALKTRNGILISPHPRAKKSTIAAAKVVLEAAVAAGAPEGIIRWIDVPETTKILIGEVESVELSEEFAHEKLSPVLAMYRASDIEDAFAKAEKLIADGGYGHTSSIYLNPVTEQAKIDEFQERMKTCRILINTPSSQGGIGDLYNFKLKPSLTLGCGSWGGNSVSENVGVKHLLNIKTVAERRENMLWFRAPEKVYLKKGCLPVALDELKHVMNKKKAFIVTDSFLYHNGYTKPITDKLDELGIVHTTFFDVAPDPTLACAKAGAKLMRSFEPDVIIALGGGSAMDAGKIMWVMYEHPEEDFMDMAMRFMDIRKRVHTFPKMGEKAYFIAIPTSAGTGSEVTPFAVITDETTGVKYPLADYELLPKMAIVDADFHMSAPRGLTAASGIDAVTHALEAYASMMATDYTDSLAIRALQMIFKYLPRAYDDGQHDPEAREKMANAATMAGMAFANAFLGVCHSMAHKLGAFHHLPHGVANALMIEEVLRFNAAEVPTKMGTFPQYDHPHTLARYAEVADALNLPGDTDEEKLESLIKAVNELKARVGIKATIKDYNIDETDFLNRLDAMTEQAFDDQCTGANPRYPLMSEIKQMYLNAYYGTRPEEPKAADGKLTDVQEGDFKAAYRAEHKMQ